MILPLRFVVLVVAFLSLVLAYQPGHYVPKSFYIIDHLGHKSDVVYIRNRRDIMEPLLRIRRGGGGGGGYASASSHASASASSSAGSGANSGGGGSGGLSPIYFGGGDDYIPYVTNGLSGVQQGVEHLFSHLGGHTGHHAVASASSSASSGAGGGGHGGYRPVGGQSFGGLGSGHDVGYDGPILFSRFGEAEGSGIHVSGQAAGPNAAFSSSHSASDGNKVHYSVQSGHY